VRLRKETVQQLLHTCRVLRSCWRYCSQLAMQATQSAAQFCCAFLACALFGKEVRATVQAIVRVSSTTLHNWLATTVQIEPMSGNSCINMSIKIHPRCQMALQAEANNLEACFAPGVPTCIVYARSSPASACSLLAAFGLCLFPIEAPGQPKPCHGLSRGAGAACAERCNSQTRLPACSLWGMALAEALKNFTVLRHSNTRWI